MGLHALNAKYYELKRRAGSFWGLIFGTIVVGCMALGGVVGYMSIEGWNLLDSVYMVVITLSTVGFMEVKPLSPAGRLLTTLLILGGVGGFLYIVAAFSQLVVEGKLQTILGRRRMQKLIERLDGHFIVCGYGRIGSVVVKEITKEGVPSVVIESNEALVERMREEGVLCIQGDATDDKLLLSAGLMKARSLITALTDEAANVYVTLTARQLNPDLLIIARANEASHITRLELAGANRVVMPHHIGGVRMAQSVLRPTVTNFMELAVRGALDLQMEELEISPASELADKNLVESRIRARFNLIIIAIKKDGGNMVFNPGPNEMINAFDTLVAVGTKADLKAIAEIL